MSGKKVNAVGLSLSFVLSLVSYGEAQKIYWIDESFDRVQRSSLDGSDMEVVVSNLVERPFGIDVDLDAEKIYWSDGDLFNIQRSNFDGSSPEEIYRSPSPFFAPSSPALDPAGGKVYWTDAAQIFRANLDGSAREAIVDAPNRPQGLVVDSAGGKLYWIEGDTIRRSNLDGSGVEDLLATGGFQLSSLALDPMRGKMYWGEFVGVGSPNEIRRANLDGTGRETLVSFGLGFLVEFGVVLDEVRGKMYWSQVLDGLIRRANLDGSGAEDVVVGAGFPLGLLVDSDGETIYWVDGPPGPAGSGRVMRASLDGSGVEELVTGLSQPDRLALDRSRGKIYWSDPSGGRIERASLDGTTVETVQARLLFAPSAITVDLSARKLYWTDRGSDRIHRAGTDGSDIEEVVASGLASPRGVAVDPIAQKLYWTDGGEDPMTGKIQRAELDGSEVEDLVTEGLSFPTDIALDPARGRMYWVEGLRLRRARLDGTNVEDVVTLPPSASFRALTLDRLRAKVYSSISISLPFTGILSRFDLDGSEPEFLLLASANAVTADPARAKLYLTTSATEFSSSQVQRVNLDGSDREILVTLPGSAQGIALDPALAPLTGTGRIRTTGNFPRRADTFAWVHESTPHAEAVGPVGVHHRWVKDVAVDPGTARVYTIDLVPGARGQQVYRIDPATGAGERLPNRTGLPLPAFVWGMAFDAAGTLYGGGLGVHVIDPQTGQALPLASVETVPALILGLARSPFGTGFLSTGIVFTPGASIPFLALHGPDGAFVPGAVFPTVDASGRGRVLFDIALTENGAIVGTALAPDSRTLSADSLAPADRSLAIASFLANRGGADVGRIVEEAERLGRAAEHAARRSELLYVDVVPSSGIWIAALGEGAPLNAVLYGLGPGTGPDR